MPPSKEACQVYLSAQSVKAKLISQYQSIVDLLSAKRKLKQDIKFGKIDLRKLSKISDISVTDLAKYAEKAANDVASTIISSASKSATQRSITSTSRINSKIK